ncbi:MAG: BglII/BstYI family type II restriction endonuclease [Gluconacetobacter sp.]
MTKGTDDLPKVITINSLDKEDRALFPDGFFDLYEVKSYRNAARILESSCSKEFRELTETLMKFRIIPDDIIVGGGNKSKIAKGVEELFHPLGWRETRVTADLLINRITYTDPQKRGKKAPKSIEQYKINSFVDGHKIDFVKNRVAFDMEWN